MRISVPETSLIVLCGVAGCGKSFFAKKIFKETQIVSSDRCRALVSDSEENMDASKEAFELFYFTILKRMKLGKLVVADSTAISYETRKRLLKIGYENNYYVLLIAFDLPIEKALERNGARDRKVSEKVIERQYAAFRKSLRYINKEGFDDTVILKESDVEGFMIDIIPPDIECKDKGPFDIISDVHGCCSELEILLEKLGYQLKSGTYTHPEGRKVVFAGDIVDRGPRIIDTITTVKGMVDSGNAYYIPGNHCNKFYRYLMDRKVQVKHGLEMTVGEFEKLDNDKKQDIKEGFIKLYENAPPYLILDGGKIVVTHAGIKEDMIGKLTKRIQDFVLYGDVTGEVDAEGFPKRGDWASQYCGKALIVYGHTPVSKALFVNNTINIDQGASIGGYLTALRYPEKEIVMVKSLDTYYTEGRQQLSIGRELRLDDYTGTIILEDVSGGKCKIESYETKKAIEILKLYDKLLPWIVYIPPIISSVSNGSIKEQIQAALEYYSSRGEEKVTAEPWDYSSIFIMVICRDMNVSQSYFSGDSLYEIYSLYNSISWKNNMKEDILRSIHSDLLCSGYFEKYNTEFLILESMVGQNNLIPVKVLAHSCESCFNQNNTWQDERIEMLCDVSKLFKKNDGVWIETKFPADGINALERNGWNQVFIRPLDSQKTNKLQPGILCMDNSCYFGEKSIKLSNVSYQFGMTGIERFMKKKLSNRYFKYIIGSIVINNRIVNIRK